MTEGVTFDEVAFTESYMGILRLLVRDAYELGLRNAEYKKAATIASPTDILNVVKYTCGVANLKEKSQEAMNARWAAAVVLHKTLSTPVIAKLVGYEDHTTIMYIMSRWERKPLVVNAVKRCLEVLGRDLKGVTGNEL